MTKPMDQWNSANIAGHTRRTEDIEDDGFVTVYPPIRARASNAVPPASSPGADGHATARSQSGSVSV